MLMATIQGTKTDQFGLSSGGESKTSNGIHGVVFALIPVASINRITIDCNIYVYKLTEEKKSEKQLIEPWALQLNARNQLS